MSEILKGKTRLTLSLDIAVAVQLRKLAHAEGLKVSSFANHLLSEALVHCRKWRIEALESELALLKDEERRDWESKRKG